MLSVSGPATLTEVSHLWWFADGAIMDGATREHLHRSWGLCTRHAWLYLRVEIELRINPLGNAVLMADLVQRAVDTLNSHRSMHHKRAELAVRDSCFTCDHKGPGQARFEAQLQAVNAGTRSADWCLSCQHLWQPVMCPSCAPRQDATGATPCREHGAGSPEELAYLARLAERMKRCVKSMTVDGPPRSADTDAALVEAIGWCSGWQPELVLRSWSESAG
jgi:hypothetical protein